MKKVLNITICLIGIALLYIGAVWNEKFIEHQFLEFDQIVSESGDNITFNLPEFDNQIIFNIYANEFFVGNRYDCLPVPLEVTRDQYEMKQKGNCILCYNNITNQKFILEAKKNKIYFKDANSNKLLYDLNKEYTNGFFIFGMGLRNKYILYRSSDIALGEYSLYDYQKKENLYVGIKNVQIDAEKYCAEGYIDKHKFQIFENEEGVYLVLDSEKYILDNSQHIIFRCMRENMQENYVCYLMNVWLILSQKELNPILLHMQNLFIEMRHTLLWYVNKQEMYLKSKIGLRI